MNQTLPGDVLLTETDASQQLTEIAANGSMSIDGPIKDTDASTIDVSTGPTDNNYPQTTDTSNEDGGSAIAATAGRKRLRPAAQQTVAQQLCSSTASCHRNAFTRLNIASHLSQHSGRCCWTINYRCSVNR